MKNSLKFAFLIVLLPFFSHAQHVKFSRADSLRGALRHERTSFDVKFYDLNIEVFPAKKLIQARSGVFFCATTETEKIQLDLFRNLDIKKITGQGKNLTFKREFDAVFITLPQKLQKDDTMSVFVEFEGKPKAAVNPPWDGGFSWEKDAKGRDWIGVSCEGLGASVWWANKDHLSDEPDSMRIVCTVPEGLLCVANGNLRSEKKSDGKASFEWFISYPINNYNVTLNIAHYAHFSDIYTSPKYGKLALDYYVLDYQLSKAKKHFEQVKPMLACYEKYFGQYPFWNDGFALVETFYWGMEHQSAIAYGNNYRNLPLYNFDYIIIHESGHEYFGNSISVKDHADMWIHEAFTTYAEAVYVEELQGKTKAQEYLQGHKMKIANSSPIQGVRDVNFKHWNDSDMYFKGAWMLHGLRNLCNNDSLFYATLLDFCQKFYHKNTNSEEVRDFFSKSLKMNLEPYFASYLEQAKPPLLRYFVEKGMKKSQLTCYFENVKDGFVLPLIFYDEKNNRIKLEISNKKQTFELSETFGTPLVSGEEFYFWAQKNP